MGVSPMGRTAVPAVLPAVSTGGTPVGPTGKKPVPHRTTECALYLVRILFILFILADPLCVLSVSAVEPSPLIAACVQFGARANHG